MFLSSKSITESIEKGSLSITPFSIENLKPASYMFTIGSILIDSLSIEETPIPEQGYILKPQSFILAQTKESINLHNNFICILGTRSSLAQKGVDALQTSTIAEPDTNGPFMLEIINHGSQDIILTIDMPIVKGIFCPIN